EDQRQPRACQKPSAPHRTVSCGAEGRSTGCSIKRCGSRPPSYHASARNRTSSTASTSRIVLRLIATVLANPLTELARAVSLSIAHAAMTIDARTLNDSEIRALAARIDRPVVLVGMMGVGKSTIGRKLAQLLAFPFSDAD